MLSDDDWVKVAVGFTAFFTGFLFTRLWDFCWGWYRLYFKAPRLDVSFSPDNDCQVFQAEYVPEGTTTPVGAREMWVRVLVTNRNPEAAFECRPYLVAVDALTPQGTIQKTHYNDSMPLVWSFEPDTESVVLPRGVKRHFDVVLLREFRSGYEVQLRHPKGGRLESTSYEPLFQKSQGLRFTVLVGANNCTPDTVSFSIRFDGNSWPPTFEVTPKRRWCC